MPSRSGLPVAGQALRHTYKTLHPQLGVNEMLSNFLMGHSPEGVSAKYIAGLIIANSEAMRVEQNKISAHVFELLRLKLGAHHAVPLVPDAPSRTERQPMKAKKAKFTGARA